MVRNQYATPIHWSIYNPTPLKEMTATYLVTLNLSDTTAISLAQVAADIEDDLQAAGHDVEEVKPWARPSLVYVAPPVVTQTAPPVPPNPFQ